MFRKGLILFAILMVAIAVAVWLRTGTKDDKTFVAMAKNVYYEAALAREPEAALHLPVLTAINRASMNRSYWGGSDIRSTIYKCTVVRKRPNSRGHKVCQFSWVMEHGENDDPPAFDKKDPARAVWQRQQWEASKRVARQHLDGAYKAPPGFDKVTSYMNTEVTRRKWPHNVCAFKTKLVLIGKMDPASKHDAYREPRASEVASLPKKTEVDECKPRKRKHPKKKVSKK